MKIGIIIPTLNEEEHIGGLLKLFKEINDPRVSEIIVVDGNSIDTTEIVVKEWNVKFVNVGQGNRAIQMNYGANIIDADILYFVHADTIPPKTCINDVLEAVENGFEMGGFRFKFNTDKKILKINSWFTQFNLMTFRGGDQSMFITKKRFNELGGFDEEYCIMEEYDLMKKAKQKGIDFKLIPKSVLVSDRKYDNNKYLQVNYANLVAMKMFNRGEDPIRIKKRYYELINHPKG